MNEKDYYIVTEQMAEWLIGLQTVLAPINIYDARVLTIQIVKEYYERTMPEERLAYFDEKGIDILAKLLEGKYKWLEEVDEWILQTEDKKGETGYLISVRRMTTGEAKLEYTYEKQHALVFNSKEIADYFAIISDCEVVNRGRYVTSEKIVDAYLNKKPYQIIHTGGNN